MTGLGSREESSLKYLVFVYPEFLSLIVGVLDREQLSKGQSEYE